MSYTTTATALPTNRLNLRGRLLQSWSVNWPLTLCALVMIPTLIAALVGLLIDPRIITGAPAWLKPAKFAVSIAIYSWTFVWMLGFVTGSKMRRLANIAASITALAFAVEMIIIAGQAFRGTSSHFNIATALDATLFSVMGVFIMLLWLMGLLLAALLLRQRIANQALAWSLRLGILVTLLGAGLGFTMTTPTAAQLDSWAAGGPVVVAGAHSIGTTDDRPGLPIVGWSTTGGDMRVGHFVGLHAMQVLPLVGWLLSRRRGLLGVAHQAALVKIVGVGYIGLVLLLAWQALRGQSIIAPDGLTLAAFAGLTLAVAAAIVATLLHARSHSAQM